MNPSDHDSDDVPNIFVYEGDTGDPSQDPALHYYELDFNVKV